MTSSRFITTPEGLRLHVREGGVSDGPPILFIHGWSQGSRAWDLQMNSPVLARRFRLLAVDLRGHGRSDAPRGEEHYISNHAWAADVHALVSSLAPARPLLVGWSYGGSVVCDYLKEHGEAAIAGICLVAPALFFSREEPGRWYGMALRRNAPEARGDDRARANAAMRAFQAACYAIRPPTGYYLAQMEAALSVRPDVRGAMTRKRLDYLSLLARLRLPVLLVHGQRDAIVLPETTSELSRIMPHADTFLPDACGHAPFAEQPDEFNERLAGFAARAFSRRS